LKLSINELQVMFLKIFSKKFKNVFEKEFLKTDSQKNFKKLFGRNYFF